MPIKNPAQASKLPVQTSMVTHVWSVRYIELKILQAVITLDAVEMVNDLVGAEWPPKSPGCYKPVFTHIGSLSSHGGSKLAVSLIRQQAHTEKNVAIPIHNPAIARLPSPSVSAPVWRSGQDATTSASPRGPASLNSTVLGIAYTPPLPTVGAGDAVLLLRDRIPPAGAQLSSTSPTGPLVSCTPGSGPPGHPVVATQFAGYPGNRIVTGIPVIPVNYGVFQFLVTSVSIVCHSPVPPHLVSVPLV